MKLTQQLIEEAIKTSHDACKGPEGCVHAQGDDDDANLGAKAMFKRAEFAAMQGVTRSNNPTMTIWYDGFHVGYRLAELLFTKTDTSKVN